MGELPPAPRPEAVDLHLEREAEGNPDNDDNAKDSDAFEGRVNDYRPDNVGADQDLEAHQNAAAQGPARFVLGLTRRRWARGSGCEHEEHSEPARAWDGLLKLG
jgi:hypothetical protein